MEETKQMIEITERVGAEPKVFPGVSVFITEDEPEDKKKKHKKDADGDAEISEAQEHEKDGTNEKDVSD